MLFLDESHDVTIAAHLLRVGFLFLFFLPVWFSGAASLVAVSVCPNNSF